MAIKMRVLYATGKKKLINIANMIKTTYELTLNSVDKVPPAYSCDKERIVILALTGKNDADDTLRRFCLELNKTRTANVALIVDGNEAFAEKVKEYLKTAGTNVIEDVLYVNGGLPFLGSVKPEEEAQVKDWLENKVLNVLA